MQLSAAAAEALLLRGCDLDNQEELERLQALEPLQLQQCQEGVSCITHNVLFSLVGTRTLIHEHMCILWSFLYRRSADLFI